MALRESQIGTEANSPDNVLVSVRESGPGIRPQSIERLFDPFYTTKQAGMGMGLAICRSIVRTRWANMGDSERAAGAPHFISRSPPLLNRLRCKSRPRGGSSSMLRVRK